MSIESILSPKLCQCAECPDPASEYVVDVDGDVVEVCPRHARYLTAEHPVPLEESVDSSARKAVRRGWVPTLAAVAVGMAPALGASTASIWTALAMLTAVVGMNLIDHCYARRTSLVALGAWAIAVAGDISMRPVSLAAIAVSVTMLTLSFGVDFERRHPTID